MIKKLRETLDIFIGLGIGTFAVFQPPTFLKIIGIGILLAIGGVLTLRIYEFLLKRAVEKEK